MSVFFHFELPPVSLNHLSSAAQPAITWHGFAAAPDVAVLRRS